MLLPGCNLKLKLSHSQFFKCTISISKKLTVADVAGNFIGQPVVLSVLGIHQSCALFPYSHGSWSHVVTAGLSDDDLRETAYEVLLVSVGAAGYNIVLSFIHPYFV